MKVLCFLNTGTHGYKVFKNQHGRPDVNFVAKISLSLQRTSVESKLVHLWSKKLPNGRSIL